MAQKKKKKPVAQQHMSPNKYLLSGAARKLEKGKCYVSSGIESFGEGMVVVSRLHKGGRVSFASYLVDSYCLGVKDTFFNTRLTEAEFDDYADRVVDQADAREISYEEAHNWVWGAVAWAAEAGIKPHKDFAITQYMLDPDTEDFPNSPNVVFGRDGEHFLVANSRSEAERLLPTLREHLGDRFDYTISDDSSDDEEFGYYDDEDDAEYDEQ